METLIPVHVRPITFKKIQKLAVLAGSEADAVDRLLAYWESENEPAPPSSAPQKTRVAVWRSTTGDILRVGETIEGRDAGKPCFATVEQNGIRYDGKLYDSPSAAARAVKEKRGLVGDAASTNGRAFWRIRDRHGHLIALRDSRPNRGRNGEVDVDALLAELDAL